MKELKAASLWEKGQEEEPCVRMYMVVLFLRTSNSNLLGSRVIVRSKKFILDPPILIVKSIEEYKLFMKFKYS